jgi:hypothetical protein
MFLMTPPKMAPTTMRAAMPAQQTDEAADPSGSAASSWSS